MLFRKVIDMDRLPIDGAAGRERLTDIPGLPGCPVLDHQPKLVTVDVEDQGIVCVAELGGGPGDAFKTG